MSRHNLRAVLSELVAAITHPEAFPIEACPFVTDEEAERALSMVRLEQNPRIVAALKAAIAALRTKPASTPATLDPFFQPVDLPRARTATEKALDAEIIGPTDEDVRDREVALRQLRPTVLLAATRMLAGVVPPLEVADVVVLLQDEDRTLTVVESDEGRKLREEVRARLAVAAAVAQRSVTAKLLRLDLPALIVRDLPETIPALSDEQRAAVAEVASWAAMRVLVTGPGGAPQEHIAEVLARPPVGSPPAPAPKTTRDVLDALTPLVVGTRWRLERVSFGTRDEIHPPSTGRYGTMVFTVDFVGPGYEVVEMVEPDAAALVARAKRWIEAGFPTEKSR